MTYNSLQGVKSDCTFLIHFRIVNIRMEGLDEQEDDFYQALYTQV